ncbi:unnamed protein product [Trichogramma brassicae]|uniref:39S ribosomal protein L41, mitochondrial n=1 Tax=Trichogramma brassicae TaxID=86971 RepID=A0A6H5IMN9_9HYME|nr:unnamed protein product [Trichogramma brassicae]
MSVANMIITRGISTSCVRQGKRNFKKFTLINKRGSRLFKEMQKDPKTRHPEIPIDNRGVRPTGYLRGDEKFITVPEMIPELVVPNLEGFKLKPYVSYRSEELYDEPFTADDLFHAVYADKIRDDFNKGLLTPTGEPVNPSPEERLTAEEARDLAASTGSDMFTMPLQPAGTLFSDEPK